MIARKSFLVVTTQFTLRLLGWIGLVVLAKQWGNFAPEAMGVIGFAMSFLALFSIIGNLGFTNAHTKRVSEGIDIGKCLGTFISIKLFLTSVMVMIMLLSLYIWKTFLGGGFTDATTESIVYVFILYYIFYELRSIPNATFQGTKEFAKRQIATVFEGLVKAPLTILVAVAGVSVVGYSISPAFSWPIFLKPLQEFISLHPTGSYAMTYVFSIAAVFLVGLFFIRKYPVSKPTISLIKSYSIFALPFALTSVIGIIAVNVDKITIGYFWSATEVGYYFTIQQILQFLVMIYSSLSFVLFPTFSAYHSTNSMDKLRNVLYVSERHISMVMMPPVFFILVFSLPIIRIMLSSAFFPAASVLIVLSFYHLLFGLNIPFQSLITGINKPGLLAKNTIIISILNIILNLLFVPENGALSIVGITGALGAAVATVLSFSIGFIRLRYIAKKHVDITLFPKSLFKHLFAGIVMAIVLFSFDYFILSMIIFRWYHLLFMAGFGLGIYLLVLFLLKEFTKEDFWFYLDILNLKKMVEYIRDELKVK